MKQTTYKTEFISKAPCSMENGVLYIVPHANLSMHKCMCGCGETVIAPIDENGGRERGFWGWTYDGKNASLHPSVGNYKQACKSHYFLTNGKVQWC